MRVRRSNLLRSDSEGVEVVGAAFAGFENERICADR